MSSRRAGAVVPCLKPNSSSLPVLMNRAVPLRSSIKINAMRPPTAVQTSDRNEVSSRVVTNSKTSALVSTVSVSKDLAITKNIKMSSKSSSSASSKPLLNWNTVKSLGSRLDRVSPSNKQGKEKSNKEEQMATSTGTESSGVFSGSDNGSIKDLNKDPTMSITSNNRSLRPPQSSTSRLTAAMAKTTSRLVSKRPTSATATTTTSSAGKI